MGFSFPGGFAEMCALPAESLSSGLALLPKSIDPALAALSEPLACCINGQEQARLSGGDSGDNVLIFGGGPIGALHALLAESRGAAKVIVSEKLPGRVAKLKNNTRAMVFNPDEEDTAEIVAAETNGEGADVILTATPAVDVDSSLLRLLSPGGRICIFSGPRPGKGQPPLDLSLVHYRELSISGAYGCSSRQFRRAAELLTSDRIRADWLITRRAGLDQIGEAFSHSSRREGMKSVVCKR
jgi:L-iditol 2-dehydrogenase